MKTRVPYVLLFAICSIWAMGCPDPRPPTACTDEGECLPGYVCSQANICVLGDPPDATVISPDAGLDAGDSGPRECVFDESKFDDGSGFAR